MIKNIIFDWSGTLSDDVRMVYESNMKVFEHFGAERISFEEYQREFVLPYMNFYKKYVPSIIKEVQDKIFTESMNKLGFAKLFPKVKETLELFYDKGLKLVVLSSNHRLEEEIKTAGVFHLFHYIKGSVHDKKEGILELIKTCDFLPEETVFVGDMVHDIESGKYANIKTAALCWEGFDLFERKEILINSNPDYLLDNIKQLRDIVLNS